jgi:hypothetical protein
MSVSTLALQCQIYKVALEQMGDLFLDGRKSKPSGAEVEQDALYEEIGRLKVELDWLKKKVGLLD